MPFLHGFRRIIHEYQPLVDVFLRIVRVEGDENSNYCDDTARCDALVKMLEKESESPFFSEGISYALLKVTERGLLDAAKILLRYGADINFEDPVSYYNPLHIAVLKNKPDMVRLLVQHGADIEKRDKIHECSPLDLACEESEKLPCLVALLELGADVNGKDKQGKTSLLHAISSSDGLTVHSVDTIQLLLEKGADINAQTKDGETIVTSLVFLIKQAMIASKKESAEIGNFCLNITRLLLAHGMDPSCCLYKEGNSSLMQISLEYFNLLYPLAVLLIQSGASMVCPYHGDSCWSGYNLLLNRLQTSLKRCSDQCCGSEILEQAEMLLDLSRVDVPRIIHLPSWLNLPKQGTHAYAQEILDLHKRVVEHAVSPPPLSFLCRAFIRGLLHPWPMQDRVKALPLPNTLKDFLLPENVYTPKPGWDCFKPNIQL